jgi:tetratricopeptide (TPR) repeat protein
MKCKSMDRGNQSQPGQAHRPRGSARSDWFEQGCEHEDAGRFHEAMRAYRQALATDGRSGLVCFNLANVFYRLRRKVEAVDFYRQSLDLAPESHEAWNNLGVVLCELRQCVEAARSFQAAISLAPWFGDPLYNLADCLEERGAISEAQVYWRDYVRVDPSSEWGRYAQSRLT